MARPRIILASGSETRQAMLRNAGLSFKVVRQDVDEDKITKNLKSSKMPLKKIPLKLAEAKAFAVSEKNKDALVIGADQVLICGGKLLSKAKDKKDAVKKLKSLRGKKHSLVSAACVVKDGKILWRYTGEALMQMRNYDDALLKKYCAVAGEALTRSVGACEFENHGAWLLEKAEGDHFTILGLPLLPLLGYLREKHGVMPV